MATARGQRLAPDVREAAEALPRQLWGEVVRRSDAGGSPQLGLVVGALDQVFDLHEQRVTAAPRHRLPPTILLTLHVIAVVSLVVVRIDAGISGGRSVLVFTSLSVSLSAVIVPIIDLDRPQQAFFKVDQEILSNVRDDMGPLGDPAR